MMNYEFYYNSQIVDWIQSTSSDIICLKQVIKSIRKTADIELITNRYFVNNEKLDTIIISNNEKEKKEVINKNY